QDNYDSEMKSPQLCLEKVTDSGLELNIYTNREIAARDLIYLHQTAAIGSLQVIHGSILWDILPRQTTIVRINRGEPAMLAYSSDQIPYLRELNAAVRIEGYLSALQSALNGQAAEPVATNAPVLRARVEALQEILEYPAWYVLLHKTEDQMHLVYAPDVQNRSLAAVFSGPDCLEAMLQQIRQEIQASGSTALEQEMQAFFSLKLGGHELIARLQTQQLDGLVFNPLGPVRSCAFNADFLQLFARLES
ncbi:MAG: hypothetical protein KDK39_15500, partial [Leptospiraceae bacterium]|nr:hypothetical protein [Leptospiraceae bacterium]